MENKTFDYSLSIKNLKDIPHEMYENDFTFHLNGKTYKTNRFLADILSPTVRQLHYLDKTANEYYINIKNSKNQESDQKSNEDEDYFSEFLNFCTFENNQIDPKKKKRYASYFYALGNIDEFLRIQPEYYEDVTEDNALDRLLLLTTILNEHQKTPNLQESNPIQKIIEFISSHFESIDKEKMKQLNIDMIELIVNNDHLKLQNEDTLLRFLLDLYSKDRKYSELFEYIIFNNVSEEMISNFISVFEIVDLNDSIWKSICQKILGKKTENENRYTDAKSVKKFEREEGKEFEGIMRNLTNETGGNIHDNGTVEITSNSIHNSSHPKNLVDYQNYNVYHSNDQTGNAFICFDFKDKSVNLSSYTIMSNGDSGNNNYNLKNWVIEVSNDGKKWKEIDHHKNDPLLNGYKIVHNFKVQQKNNEFFRFIKLRQTGDSWTSSSDKLVWFYFLEFYGKIKYPSN